MPTRTAAPSLAAEETDEEAAALLASISDPVDRAETRIAYGIATDEDHATLAAHRAELAAQDRRHNLAAAYRADDWLAVGFRRHYELQRTHRGASRQQRPGTVRRAGSRRGTGGGKRASPSADDDPSESEPRRCECGCGADLTGRRPQTRFDTDACRKRAERADFAQTAEGEHTVRFLVENSRLWQEVEAERSWGVPA